MLVASFIDLKGNTAIWGGGSSFASLWFERWLVRACKCAYDCVLAFIRLLQYH
jgi:hypothetical protein